MTGANQREIKKDEYPDLGRQPADSVPEYPKKGQKKGVIKAVLFDMKKGKKGSLTVEAALAVPIFFFTICALILMQNFFGASARQTVHLQEMAEKAGMAEAAASGLLSGGAEPVIDLPKAAAVRIPFVPIPPVRIAARGRVRAWTGRDPASLQARTDEKDPLVYVTDYESVYHTSAHCTHLHLKIRGVPSAKIDSMCNHSHAHYKPCEKCSHGKPKGIVYLTPEGDRWHNDPHCSGLKRTTRMIHRSEAKTLKECSRCESREAKELKSAG